MFDKSVKENKVEKVENKIVETSTIRELPEWLTKSDIFEIRKLKNYPIFELHEELIRLEKWLQPTPFDKYIRECVIEDIQKAFSIANFQAEIYPFGSFLTNLYFLSLSLHFRCLPNSDLDIMVECDITGNSFKKIERVILFSIFLHRLYENVHFQRM